MSRRGDAGLPLKGEWTRQVPHVESPGAARVLVHACVGVCVCVCVRMCVCARTRKTVGVICGFCWKIKLIF